MSRKKTTRHAIASPNDLAAFWCLTLRTIQRYLKARGQSHTPTAAQLAAPRKILRWYSALPSSTQSRLSPAFRERILRVRLYAEKHPAETLTLATPALAPPRPPPAAPPLAALRPPGAPASAPTSADPDPDADPIGFLDPAELAAFESTYDATTSAHDALNDLRRQRAYWLRVIETAKRHRDEHTLDVAGKHFTTYDTALHKAELRAQKQSSDLGDTLPRATVERFLRSLVAQLMRCNAAALSLLPRRLLNLSFAEEARAQLEPALLTSAFLEPLARSVASPTGQALPPWALPILADAVDDYLADGRAQLLSATRRHLDTDSHADGSGI